MKLLVYSDLHLECGAAFSPPAGALGEADVIVLAGDIDIGWHGVNLAPQVFPDKPIIYVAGNHEHWYGDYPHTVRRMRSAADSTDGQVRCLERSAVVIDGVRFLGTTLWTDFCLHAQDPEDHVAIHASMADAMQMPDYQVVHRSGTLFGPEDSRREHLLSRAWLLASLRESFEGPTVVVTHHAPSPRSGLAHFARHPLGPCFSSKLPSDLFDGADLWIHGHMHSSSDYLHHSCRVVCNPRGAPWPDEPGVFDNPHFNPALIVEV